MYKWAWFVLAVAALLAFGWMLNDIRLEIRMAEKTDKQLPVILSQTERVTDQLDRHLPRLLAQPGQAAGTINNHMPRLMTQTERAGTTINSHLPTLLTSSEAAVDNLAELSDSFRQYKGLMGSSTSRPRIRGCSRTGQASWA